MKSVKHLHSVILFERISPLVSPTGKEALIPIQVFVNGIVNSTIPTHISELGNNNVICYR